MRIKDLDTFTRAYIEAALWSSTDDDGEPLDGVHTVDDVHPDTLARMVRDCELFREACADDLATCDDVQAGHDYWLTRNGHGAGFWDRGLGEVGTRLTDAAHADGSCDLYVGDDGLIHAF